MKKWIALLSLVLCLTTVLIGCGEKDAADGGTPTTTIAQKATTTKSKFIAEEQALAKAAAHWNIRPGDRDPDTGFLFSIIAVELPTDEKPTYRVMLRWLVETEEGPTNYSTVDVVLVDAVTGTVLVSE